MNGSHRFELRVFSMQVFMHLKRGGSEDRRKAYDEIARAHETKDPEAAWRHLQQVYAEEGLALTREGRVGNPLEAQRLIWLAGKHNKSVEVLEALLEACHAKGEALSDLKVLNECAHKAGLAQSATDDVMARFLVSPKGASEVALQISECLTRGVTTSPVVVLDDRFPLMGAQPYAVVGACLAELLATGTNFRVVEATTNTSAHWP